MLICVSMPEKPVVLVIDFGLGLTIMIKRGVSQRIWALCVRTLSICFPAIRVHFGCHKFRTSKLLIRKVRLRPDLYGFSYGYRSFAPPDHFSPPTFCISHQNRGMRAQLFVDHGRLCNSPARARHLRVQGPNFGQIVTLQN
jgi:hypothetical protein